MTTPADQASEALNAAVRAFADNPTPETQATLEAAQRAALDFADGPDARHEHDESL